MASEYPKMSKQHTAGKIKNISIIVPRISHIIRRLESGKSQRLWLRTTFDHQLTMI